MPDLPLPDQAVEAAARALHTETIRRVRAASGLQAWRVWNRVSADTRDVYRREARAVLTAAAPILAQAWAEDDEKQPSAIQYDGSVDLDFLRPNEKVRNAGPNGSHIEVITEYAGCMHTIVVAKGEWIVRGKDGTLTAALTPGDEER